MKFYDKKRKIDDYVYDSFSRCVAFRVMYTLTILWWSKTWFREEVVVRTTEVRVERFEGGFRVLLEGKYPGAYGIESNNDLPDLWQDVKRRYPLPEDELHAMAMEAVEKYFELVGGRESA